MHGAQPPEREPRGPTQELRIMELDRDQDSDEREEREPDQRPLCPCFHEGFVDRVCCVHLRTHSSWKCSAVDWIARDRRIFWPTLDAPAVTKRRSFLYHPLVRDSMLCDNQLAEAMCLTEPGIRASCACRRRTVGSSSVHIDTSDSCPIQREHRRQLGCNDWLFHELSFWLMGCLSYAPVFP